MLIGIDASRANRAHRTGTEWYAYYLIRWLAKLDSKNQYILYSDKPLNNGLVDLSTVQYQPSEGREAIVFDDEGYQQIISPYHNFRGKILKWPLKYLWTQGRLSLEMLVARPDLLFIPSHTLPWLHPKQSVVTIHDVGFEKEANIYAKENIVASNSCLATLIDPLVRLATAGKYRATNIDYLRWSTIFALKHAARIITVSQFSKNDIIHFYQPALDKIKVIHNGYNRTIYKRLVDDAASRKVLEKYGITRPYLFYIGRIEHKKNIPALIEAFALLKEKHPELKHKLVLAGNASYGYDETMYMIKEFQLDNEVLMPGWTEEQDLPCIYCGADAFVFPSIYEGFGIPLLQAMACGVPIAASNAASIPEIVGDAALLFDPHDIQSIADAMYKILTDQKIRDELAEKSAIRVKAFSWQKCAEETLALFNFLHL